MAPVPDATTRLVAFMNAAAAELARDPSAMSQHISRAMTKTQNAPPALPPAQMPASRDLPDMLTGAPPGPAQLVAACAGDLHWRVAGFGKLPDVARQKLAVAELIGPNGLFPAQAVRIGLLIQRQGFHYPKHHHAAPEVYLVVHGTAHWGVDDTEPTPRKPGSIIHHNAHQPHQIVTPTEPLLALWGWTGDVGGASYTL
ncbi:MAG: dimethylsulfonioproprionate lyase family protein [Sedimentitalea sp.]